MNTCQWVIFNDSETSDSHYCGKPCEGKSALCASHGRLARKITADAEKEAVKISVNLAKANIKNSQPRPIPNKVSDKRKVLNEEYFKLVEQFKKDNPECKAKINDKCTKLTEDPHHTRGRGRYLLDVSTWYPVCRSCHSYIEAHPNEAKEKGWSESRLAKTEPHKI